MIWKVFVLAAIPLACIASSAAFADRLGPPVSGNATTWSRSILLLQNDGYTHVMIIQSAVSPGWWIGSASKDGRRVDVAIDPEGKVIER